MRGLGLGFSQSWSLNPWSHPCSTRVGSSGSVPCPCFSEMELTPKLQMSFPRPCEEAPTHSEWSCCSAGHRVRAEGCWRGCLEGRVVTHHGPGHTPGRGGGLVGAGVQAGWKKAGGRVWPERQPWRDRPVRRATQAPCCRGCDSF